ncbi:MAG: hypothetical protein Q8869_00740, partial [Candidatus Phytoplasma australasiaticum]|nr:hypothetical protein [Candidatus Phytoplasma australasiaticum]
FIELKWKILLYLWSYIIEMKLPFRKSFFSNAHFLKKVSNQNINELLIHLSSSLNGLSLEDIDERKKNNVNILNKKKIIILSKL